MERGRSPLDGSVSVLNRPRSPRRRSRSGGMLRIADPSRVDRGRPGGGPGKPSMESGVGLAPKEVCAPLARSFPGRRTTMPHRDTSGPAQRLRSKRRLPCLAEAISARPSVQLSWLREALPVHGDDTCAPTLHEASLGGLAESDVADAAIGQGPVLYPAGRNPWCKPAGWPGGWDMLCV